MGNRKSGLLSQQYLCMDRESFTVVYKDANGVAVLYRCEEASGIDYYQPEETELIWVELAVEKP